jgi:hypothetical protein
VPHPENSPLDFWQLHLPYRNDKKQALKIDLSHNGDMLDERVKMDYALQGETGSSRERTVRNSTVSHWFREPPGWKG